MTKEEYLQKQEQLGVFVKMLKDHDFGDFLKFMQQASSVSVLLDQTVGSDLSQMLMATQAIVDCQKKLRKITKGREQAPAVG